jgi:pyruvate/2-oxoglutarate dehydrogenase complex dihydrolipoamide acyltransferase (E2) component
MKLTLQMPSVGPQLQGGRVIKWSKAPGESFIFGDELCVVSIEQVVALRKTQQASILTSLRRKKKVREEVETRETSGLRFQLVASEGGVVLEHLVATGGGIKVGDTLALLASGGEPGGEAAQDIASLPSIRVVANAVDIEEE